MIDYLELPAPVLTRMRIVESAGLLSSGVQQANRLRQSPAVLVETGRLRWAFLMCAFVSTPCLMGAINLLQRK
jgi:hypothetical protein